ncbi:MAG: cupin domain-containing protein [Pseudonocardiaceae bacterium]
MRSNRKRILTAVTAASAAASLGVLIFAGSPADATPGSGAEGTIVAQGTTDEQVHVEAHGQTQLVFQRVTLQPGGSTGWHTHPGPLLVVVESGTLTHYDRTCKAHTYTAGQALEEPAGRHHVHMGANKGTDPAILEVTYVIPVGSPLRDEAPAPACKAE